MNDELDALRSFRPEAAGPTDGVQLRERLVFLETLGSARAGASRGKTFLRSSRRVMLAIGIAVVTVAGTAAAAGMIPDDVQQALGLAAAHTPDTSLSPEIDQAVERTSTPTAGGGTLELWTAPTSGGGTCAYLRQLDAAGAPTDSGPISCAVSIAGGRSGEMTMTGQAGSHGAGSTMTMGNLFDGGRLSAQIQVDASGAATLFGLAPNEVAKMEVVDSNGAVLADSTPDNGWFLLTLPPASASAAVSLVAQATSGATLATMLIVPAPPPTTSTTDEAPA
jgi:hypothetical protein